MAMIATTPLRVVVAHRPPFIFVATDSSTGQKRYYGMLVDLLDRLLRTSNLNNSYAIYESPTNAGGSPLPDGNWTGVVGELVAERADITLFPLTRTLDRTTAVDCTYSYMDAGLSLLVNKKVPEPGALSFLAPFETRLWILLLCTVFSIALLFNLLDLYTRTKAKRAQKRKEKALHAQLPDISRTSSASNTPLTVKDSFKKHSHFMMSWHAAAGVAERPRNSGVGVQVLYVCYCFFCLVVLSSYTANLTAYLSVTHATTAISDIRDLIYDNGRLGVNGNGSTAAYFSSSKDTLATQLQPNVAYCDTPTCLQWLRDGTIAAFVSDRPLLSYQANLAPCDLGVVGDDFGPGNLVVGLQKGSPLLQPFNRAMQLLAEDGSLTSLRRLWFDNLSQCRDDTDLNSTRLGIPQMFGLFIFLASGVVIAFALASVENVTWCVKKKYPEVTHSVQQLPATLMRTISARMPDNPTAKLTRSLTDVSQRWSRNSRTSRNSLSLNLHPSTCLSADLKDLDPIMDLECGSTLEMQEVQEAGKVGNGAAVYTQMGTHMKPLPRSASAVHSGLSDPPAHSIYTVQEESIPDGDQQVAQYSSVHPLEENSTTSMASQQHAAVPSTVHDTTGPQGPFSNSVHHTIQSAVESRVALQEQPSRDATVYPMVVDASV